MNWEAIAAGAELLAATGVVASLLYLSLQVRQNTTALRAATFQSIIGFATGFAESVARDGDLARLFNEGLANAESGNDVDRFRFHFQMIALFRRFENMHYQSRMQLLDDAEWEGLRASLDTMLLRPGGRAWWKSNATLFNRRFREFIENRID